MSYTPRTPNPITQIPQQLIPPELLEKYNKLQQIRNLAEEAGAESVALEASEELSRVVRQIAYHVVSTVRKSLEGQ